MLIFIVMSAKMAHRGSFTFRSQQYLKLKLHLELRNHFSITRPQFRTILKDEGNFPHVKNSLSNNWLFKLLDKTAFLKMRQWNYSLSIPVNRTLIWLSITISCLQATYLTSAIANQNNHEYTFSKLDQHLLSTLKLHIWFRMLSLYFLKYLFV